MSRTDTNSIVYDGVDYTQVLYSTGNRPDHYTYPTRQTNVRTAYGKNMTQTYRRGFVTANYHNALVTGTLTVNAFDFSYQTDKVKQGFSFSTSGPDIWGNTNHDDRSGALETTCSASYARALPNSLLVTNLSNSSKNGAILKVRDQDVNLGEVWGERHESVNMIRTAAERVRSVGIALRKGDFAGAAQHLGVTLKSNLSAKLNTASQSKALANGWLELQYGWLPLLSDVHGAVEGLRKSLNTSTGRSMQRVASSKKLAGADNSYVKSTFGTGGTRTERTYDVEVKTVLHYRQRAYNLPMLSQFGISNPLETYWALTKYSFVVDWFVHISNFLSQFDVSTGYEFFDSSITTFKRAKEVITYAHSGPTSANGLSTESAEWMVSSEIVSCIRTSGGTTWPYALPAFKDPSSVQHALNTIALLRQSSRS